MRAMILLWLAAMFVSGCAITAPPSQRGLQIGSATSRNLFVDPSQFANRTVKLRLRNSSGDSALDIVRLRQSVESGLRAAGYEIGEKNFGIVIDVNAFQFQSAATARLSNSSGVGTLLGGVAGYEATKKAGGVSAGAGLIVGAIAGATIEDILRNHDARSTFVALCDVNIGVVRKESSKKDRFTIGGNAIDRAKEDDEQDTFTHFAIRESVRVAAYAGDDADRSTQTINALVDRLGRVVANLL